MRVLGIDPGLATAGYGIIETSKGFLKAIEFNCVITPPYDNKAERLLRLFESFDKIIKYHKPDQIAMERLFFARNITTAMMVSEARGVILLAAAINKASIVEYTPMEVKMAVAGFGRADKSQVGKMVKVILNLESVPKPDDTADALAVAICHIHSGKKPK